jgi:hypothetical protein
MTARRTVMALACWVVLASASSAFAQRWFMPDVAGFGMGWGAGLGYGGVGTPASLEGQAMADMVRSQGMYNAMTSGAMINVEEARSKFIDNQRQWTEVYMMKQRARREVLAQREQDRQVRQARLQEHRESRPSNPIPPLTTAQLDPATGKVRWPTALERPAFTPFRTQLDDLFAARAHTGTTSEIAQAINTTIREMQAELRKHIRDIVTSEYLEARRFLDSLLFEGQQPVG